MQIPDGATHKMFLAEHTEAVRVLLNPAACMVLPIQSDEYYNLTNKSCP